MSRYPKLRLNRTFTIVLCLLFIVANNSIADVGTQDFGEGSATIKGKVIKPENASASTESKPVEILAYHLETEKLYTVNADGSGNFLMQGLPHGYFDLAVRVAEDFYPVGEVLHLPPKSKRVTTLTLIDRDSRPQEYWDEQATRDFIGKNAGVDATPSGLAEIKSKMTGRDFWRTGKGVAILATVGGAGLLAIAASDDSDFFDDPSSEFEP